MFRVLTKTMCGSPVLSSLLRQHSFINARPLVTASTPAERVDIKIELTVLRIDFRTIDTRILHNLPWQDEIFPTQTYISVPAQDLEEVTQRLQKHHAITKINDELTPRGTEFYAESSNASTP